MDYHAIYQMVLLREKLAGPKLHGYSQLPSLLAQVDRDLKGLEETTRIAVEAANKADADAAAKKAADEAKAKADADAAKAKIDEDAAAAKAKADVDAATKAERAEKAPAKPERAGRT